MNESHPVDVAEYARARGIDKEPTFIWWVSSPYSEKEASHPSSTQEEKSLQVLSMLLNSTEKNGNNLWNEVLEMEMYNIGVAFEILEDGKTAPAGYTNVSGHLLWSVKMDFTRKASWVLDAHKTHDPVGFKYAGVVSRESV